MKFAFGVDEGQRRPNPSRDKKMKASTAGGRWCNKEAKKEEKSPASCVTPFGSSILNECSPLDTLQSVAHVSP